MRNTALTISKVASAVAVIGSLAMAPALTTAQDAPSLVEQGKKVAFDRRKGNCLACHAIAGGDLPGTIGPPLIAMKARYPDKAKLRAQIYDARQANPATVMPPYGPHAILSSEEIDKIVEFIYTL